MVYIYPEKNLRAYPGIIHGTEEWDNTYKIRTVVERDINHIKDNLCLAERRPKTRRLYMLILFLPVSHNSLRLFLQTKSIIMNTFEA